jgi:pyruvate kinase
VSKRTKIVATIGPASGTLQRIGDLIDSGVDMFRVNFSHGTTDERAGYLRDIRAVESEKKRPVAICADLCGPKIRVGVMRDGGADLERGSELVVQREPVDGTAERISTTLHELVDLVAVGDRILLADGRLRLAVVDIAPPEHFTCRVEIGGRLTSGKGVNLPDSDLPLSPLTEKDRQDVDWIAARDFDYVALSFVQRASDVEELRTLLRAAGNEAQIIAKIEKPRALKEIDTIIAAADAIMVARGDLGVEMALPAVPIAQKSIVRRCEAAGTPCIIATEMLESMIQAPTPTRAEVSDVANAVFDHADAVMLSAESSIGRHPLESVCMMRDTLLLAEQYQDEQSPPSGFDFSEPVITAALAGAVRQIIQRQPIAAVVVLTASGRTARLIAKNRPPCPILALSSEMPIVRRCCLYYGTVPRQVGRLHDVDELIEVASALCKEAGLAQRGQYILILAGHPLGTSSVTDALLIEQVV